MSDTPINVFGRSTDAQGIARLIADRLDRATIEPAGNGFAVRSAAKRGLLKKSGRDVTVNVGLEYFEGDAGRRQTLGMDNFIRTTMGGPGLAEVLATVPECRIAVAFITEPAVVATRSDPIFQLALEVAAAADGFVLSVGEGRVWSSSGEVLASVELREEVVDATGDFDDEDFVADPPSRERVEKRLLVLTAVAGRGLAEAEGEYLIEAREGSRAWLEGLDAAAELEPAERRLIDAEAGAVDQMDQVNASWRTEGAAVLAWSLGMLELPPHDRPIDPGDLAQALGFPSADAARERLSRASLRPPTELDAFRERMFAVHWRLREHSLRPTSMDFAEFARTAWFGPLDIGGIHLVGGDLAVDGRPINEADPAAIRTTTSVVMERHLAANWLHDGGVYSETDTST